MLIIGFILIAAAAAAATILIVQNTGHVQVHALGHSWFMSASWLVVFGLVLLAIAMVGIAAVRHSGARRARRQRDMMVEREVAPAARPDYMSAEPPVDDEAPAATPRRRFHRHRPAM